MQRQFRRKFQTFPPMHLTGARIIYRLEEEKSVKNVHKQRTGTLGSSTIPTEILTNILVEIYDEHSIKHLFSKLLSKKGVRLKDRTL